MTEKELIQDVAWLVWRINQDTLKTFSFRINGGAGQIQLIEHSCNNSEERLGYFNPETHEMQKEECSIRSLHGDFIDYLISTVGYLEDVLHGQSE